MTFNINSFKTRGLTLGGARPALFEVQFTPPPAIGVIAGSQEKFTYTCRGAQLPAATVGSIDVGYFGRMIKLAGDRTFTDWTVTVNNDEDFLVRGMFEKWSNYINKFIGNTRTSGGGGALPAEADYKCNMTVIQFSKAGAAIRAYDIVGAFPTTVDAIDLNWETQNQIETFGVTFSYDYWIPSTNYSEGNANPYLNEVLF